MRYAEQSGRLGYYAFTPHAGTGLMRAGLSLVISVAFRELGLHRLEANIQRSNVRSIALVEGSASGAKAPRAAILKIGNRWRDHERWALLKEDWRKAALITPARARVAERQRRRVDGLAQHERRVHADHAVDARDLRQQEPLILVHVRHADLELVVRLLAR